MTGIELKQFSSKTVKNFTNAKLGFTESLKTPTTLKSNSKVNTNICQNIFMNGLNVTKKYFYPSQFPNITRIKPIAITMKKNANRDKKFIKRKGVKMKSSKPN